MKWNKQKFKITKNTGDTEVEGAVCGQWGIDKRDNSYYVLTYIPNGCFVESARTMKFLKMLVDTPEFQCYNGGTDKTALKDLADCICRYRNKFGWTA